MINAKTESFERVTVLNQPALFTCARIDRKTIPDGYYAYDVRHDDDGEGCPCELAPSIMVNHWGTIITANPIEMSDDGRRYLDVVEEELDDDEKEEFEQESILVCNDWNYEGGQYTLEDFINDVDGCRTIID